MRATLTYWRRLLWIEARWAAESIGYAVRPYDLTTDARRWRWQRRLRCGSAWWASLSDEQRTELADALRDQIERGHETMGERVMDLRAYLVEGGTDCRPLLNWLIEHSTDTTARELAAHLSEIGEGDRIAGLTLAVTVLTTRIARRSWKTYFSEREPIEGPLPALTKPEAPHYRKALPKALSKPYRFPG